MARCSCLQALASGCLLCQKGRVSVIHNFSLSFWIIFLTSEGFRVDSTLFQQLDNAVIPAWAGSVWGVQGTPWFGHLLLRTGSAGCVHVCMSPEDFRQQNSSGLGLIASASALQIISSSFKRSFEAKLRYFSKGSPSEVCYSGAKRSGRGREQKCGAWSDGSAAAWAGSPSPVLPRQARGKWKGENSERQRGKEKWRAERSAVDGQWVCRLCRCVSGFGQRLSAWSLAIFWA